MHKVFLSARDVPTPLIKSYKIIIHVNKSVFFFLPPINESCGSVAKKLINIFSFFFFSGMTNDKKVQSVILKHVGQLPEEEQVIVQTKLSGAETLGDIEIKEQNELLMMLLRAHCESKQNRHVHDTAENRYIFTLNTGIRKSGLFIYTQS